MIVGIFSRDAQEHYQWLTDLLTSPMFKPMVIDVRTVCVTNNDFQDFRDEVSKCAFAILYHTRRRGGRLSIVSISDALYDDELQYLSIALGREKVVVVVDDLDDSSTEEKRRMLSAQPDIIALACELFLFSEEEKPFVHGKSARWTERWLASREQELFTLTRKLSDLKRIIRKGYRSPWAFGLIQGVIISLIIVLVTIVLVVLHFYQLGGTGKHNETLLMINSTSSRGDMTPPWMST